MISIHNGFKGCSKILSEALINNPISLIETLLKKNLEDKERLLYLKNTIKNGNTVGDSDKEFLQNMKIKLKKINSAQSFRQDELTKKIKTQESYDEREGNFSEIDPDLLRISNLMDELKKNNSRLMNNLERLRSNDLGLMAKLEILRINREIASQSQFKETSFSGINENITKRNNADDTKSVKQSILSDRLGSLKNKKHDLMVLASIGTFTLWFASFRNIIDLGGFQNIFLGLTVGTALAAGYLYKKKKSNKS